MSAQHTSIGRVPWRTVVLGAAVLVALVVLRVVGTSTATETPETIPVAAPVAPAPPPTPAPAPPPRAPDPTPVVPRTKEEVAEALRTEFGVDVTTVDIVRTVGFTWTGIFEDGFDFLADEGDWMEWTRHFAPRPIAPIAGEPFEERARLVVDPTICHVFHRQVTDPRVGFGGEAGARVTAAITEYLGPFPYTHLEDDESFEWCEEVAAGEWAMEGYVLDELVRVPCGRPGAPEIRCFVASRSYYDLAVRNHWIAQPYIVDRATGGPADLAAQHPGLTPDEVDRLFELAVRWTEPEGIRDSYSGGVVVPEPDGLAMWWFDYYDWQVGLDSARILIPWDVVDAIVAHGAT